MWVFWIKSCICQRSTDIIHRDNAYQFSGGVHVYCIYFGWTDHITKLTPQIHQSIHVDAFIIVLSFSLGFIPSNPISTLSCVVFICFCPATAHCQSRFNSKTEEILICLWWGQGVRYIYPVPDRYQVCVPFFQYANCCMKGGKLFVFVLSSLWFIFQLLTMGCGCMFVWSCINVVGMWRSTSRTTD